MIRNDLRSAIATYHRILAGKTLVALCRLYNDGQEVPETLGARALELVKECPSSVHVLEGVSAALRITRYGKSNSISFSYLYCRLQDPEREGPPAKKKKIASGSQPVLSHSKKQPFSVLMQVLPLVAPNGMHESASLRKATLSLLATFEPPPKSDPIAENVSISMTAFANYLHSDVVFSISFRY